MMHRLPPIDGVRLSPSIYGTPSILESLLVLRKPPGMGVEQIFSSPVQATAIYVGILEALRQAHRLVRMEGGGLISGIDESVKRMPCHFSG